MPEPIDATLGATVRDGGVAFAVHSGDAARMELCLFDDEGRQELRRIPMQRDGDLHHVFVEGIGEGTRYGLRADGVFSPDDGLWFDPAKLLVDPYAKKLDRRFVHDVRLTQHGVETADLVPKAIVTVDRPVAVARPQFRRGGVIYEVAVRGFTMLHPEVPEHLRGTIAALAHPAVIAHLKRIGVDAVELMPIVAWIDERHLPPLGLHNSWGYNPIALMALDPRLAPGGVAELASTVATLHAEGIGVILDLVFNHSGESDRFGATLSMRGLDNRTYYRHADGSPGTLVNDTGCGNTIACDHPVVRKLILDTMRHFVVNAGADGFRFDLASILGRTSGGFDPNAVLFREMRADPVLADRILIAEPWDIGPGGYQLGNFPEHFLEWNDRFRDDTRLFWRGDPWRLGAFVTALCGSSDVFGRGGAPRTRSVNFVAAHDGFTLMDLVSYRDKHNEANGEDNRDGHNDNHSWNNGAEGATDDPDIGAARRRDAMALLASLFVSKGTVLLTAGDEGGRSQRGNNNAYCQDNAITWLDWASLDAALIAHTAALAAIRRRFAVFTDATFFGDDGAVSWLRPDGAPMQVADWEAPTAEALVMLLESAEVAGRQVRLAVCINRGTEPVPLALPAADSPWRSLLAEGDLSAEAIAPRSIDIRLASS